MEVERLCFAKVFFVTKHETEDQKVKLPSPNE